MPAPTALLKPAEAAENVPLPVAEPVDDELQLDLEHSEFPDESAAAPVQDGDTEMAVDLDGRPRFAPGKDIDPAFRRETRKIPIPFNRMSAINYPPLVEHCKLQVKMNVKEKRIELRSSKSTPSAEALQMGADFVTAFALGFELDDAIALLRVDSLYIQTFDIKDVKQTLHGDALGRAIGRIAGKDGKTKYAIETATKTRFVLAGSRVSILGAFDNIHMARESIVSLILGAQPGKVYNNLRIMSARLKERY